MHPVGSMAQVERKCPHCGLTFRSEKLGALCPACLLDRTFDEEAVSDEPAFWEDAPGAKPPPARTFSHFEILDELGRGGMGIVYRVRDLKSERILALKVLQAHHLQVSDLVLRFRSEVRAVSSLDHPHVLPIYEVGEHDGIPFFSMKLTTGGSLAQRLGNYLGKPRETAQLLAKVARGVQHAHERGILHRDLKPGNILLDAAGEPYVCDFGLAKWLEDDRKLTVTSAVLGTPHYIAPEQAQGSKALTTAVDIYSLGAILYELLTGRPPFVGGTVLETLVASQEKSPERPSSIARNVPVDLETICLKALQHDPNARYSTAAAFAEDLENWMAGRTIHARPVSAAVQLWRWAKRNPLPAGLFGALAVTITTIAILSTFAAIRIEHARLRAVAAENEAVKAKADSEEQLYHSLLAQARAARLTGAADHRFGALQAIQRAAQIHPSQELRDEAIAALTLVDVRIVDRASVRENPAKQPLKYDSSLQNIYVGAEDGSIRTYDVSSSRLIDEFQWNRTPVVALCASGTRFVAARHKDNTIEVWSTTLHKLVKQLADFPLSSRQERWCYDFCFSPDETQLAIARPDGEIIIFSTATWTEVARLDTHLVPNVVRISHDGGLLAVADGKTPTIQFWDIRSSPQRVHEIQAPAMCHDLAWSPTSPSVALGCRDFCVYFLNTNRWEFSSALRGHVQEVTGLAFSPDGTLLASTSRDLSIRVWDVKNRFEHVYIAGVGGDASMQFSSTGQRLGTTQFNSDGILLEFGGLEKIMQAAHSDVPNDFATLVSSVAFSPDEKWIATASFRSVTIWDAARADKIATVVTGTMQERNVQFLDARRLLIGFKNAPPEVYDLSDPSHPTLARTLSTPPQGILGASAAPEQIVSATEERIGGVYIFSARDYTPIRMITGETTVWDALAAPDAKWIALSYSGAGPERVHIVGRNFDRFIDTGSASTLTADAKFRMLVTTGGLGAKVWDTSTWNELPLIPQDTDAKAVVTAAFSPDGTLLALSAKDSIYLVDLARRSLLFRLRSHILNSQEYRLAFSPSGKRLAAQGQDNSLRIWDLTAIYRELAQLGLKL